MSVKFKSVARRNPQDQTLPEKYYATAIADGEVDLDTLAEQIAYECTVTESDCYAVLLALVRNVSVELERGRIVKLGKLGNFQVGISSQGMDTEAEVNTYAITKSRILFRPSKRLRGLLAGLSYRKAS